MASCGALQSATAIPTTRVPRRSRPSRRGCYDANQHRAPDQAVLSPYPPGVQSTSCRGVPQPPLLRRLRPRLPAGRGTIIDDSRADGANRRERDRSSDLRVSSATVLTRSAGTDRRFSHVARVQLGSWFGSEVIPAAPNARTEVRHRPPNIQPRILTPHVAASPAPSARRTGRCGSHFGHAFAKLVPPLLAPDTAASGLAQRGQTMTSHRPS